MSQNSYLVRSALAGSLGGLLFGFDTAVIAGATSALTQEYHLSAAALGFTVSSALWGTVISAATAGLPAEKYGARETLRIVAILYLVSAIGCAFAWNWEALVFFRFIGGLGIGCSSVLGPIYIAELAPADWRGRLVGLFQINIVVGILIAYFSNYIIGTFGFGDLEWRWKLGVSGIPALLFLIMLFGIPRSPRWLILRGHVDEARKVLTDIGSNDVETEISNIVESAKAHHSRSSEPLFQRQYLRPILLAIAVGMFNQLTGINAILYYLNDIFAQAGFSRVSSDMQAVAIGATNLIFTLVAMSVIDKFGRKKLLLIGAAGMAVVLAGVAFIFGTHQYNHLLVWLLILYIGFFAASQGAVIWVYISEVFPNIVRAKGQSLGCSTHWVMNAIISGTFPLLAKESGALPFAFFSAMMVLQFIVVHLWFPETKGLALEDIEKDMTLHGAH